MGKVILVFDMPEDCMNCRFKVIGAKRCKMLPAKLDWFLPEQGRATWCPLRPMPERAVLSPADSDFSRGYAYGFNACLALIGGEYDK